jgi:exodeoxyribonuclease III
VILKLLTYNIRFGGAGRESQIVEVIRAANPDIVIFQEATVPHIVTRIAEETGMRFHVSRRNLSVSCCSRIQIRHHEWHYPARSKHPYLEIWPDGITGRIFGLHLRAMFSNWGERRRKIEILALLSSIKEHQHGFHVVLGDFNTLAPNELLDVKKMPRWIRTMIWLSGRNLQRETIQLMLDRGYADVFRSLNELEQGYTLPTYDPHLRLDYVFAPARDLSRFRKCQVISQPPAVEASDHFPVLCEIDFNEG